MANINQSNLPPTPGEIEALYRANQIEIYHRFNQYTQVNTPTTVTVPPNYPKEPTPGKISVLFDANKDGLYHKFDARDYDGGNIWFGSRQPYIYRYPGEAPSSFQQFGGRGLPLGLGVDDVVRITKYIASGRGLLFVAKQFLLQGFQPFDETNIYNPTEIVLSAASNLTGGILEKPKRHIDKSGGLLGGLAALVGVGISRSQPPPSTVAAGNGSGGSSEGSFFGGFSLLGNSGQNRESEVLPVQNYGNATGLLRAKTANKARGILQAKWGAAGDSKKGGILGFVKNIAKSIFPQVFGADKQNYKQRADDVAYDWMISYYNKYTANNWAVGQQQSGLSVSFMGIGLKKGSSSKNFVTISNSGNKLFSQKYYTTKDEVKIYNKSVYSGTGKVQTGTARNRGAIPAELVQKNNESSSEIESIYTGSAIGQYVKDTLSKQKYYDYPHQKINDEPIQSEKGRVPNNNVIDRAYEEYSINKGSVTSRELVQESEYIKKYDDKSFTNVEGAIANSIIPPSRNTKLNDNNTGDPINIINENLKKVINDINQGNIYKAGFTNKNTYLFSSGETTKQGYDRLRGMLNEYGKGNEVSLNATNTIRKSYIDGKIRTLDSIVNNEKNYGFSGKGRPDKINTLKVLDKKRETQLYKGNDGKWVKWEPYQDDLIAFFFYDVVNERYIPFRATVKGLSEQNNASWDELKFIGRSDALYSYSGFTRTLSFSFTVVVNSIIELFPTWMRINYLASSVKPSRYNKFEHNFDSINKFAVPPMFMLTIGDMYKYQPIVITSVTVNIPDTAIWETMPEDSEEDWTYLADIIKTKIYQGRIAQFPREADISIACNVLEKELPEVGGNHYGHSPKDQEGYKLEVENVDYLPKIKDFSRIIRANPNLLTREALGPSLPPDLNQPPLQPFLQNINL